MRKLRSIALLAMMAISAAPAYAETGIVPAPVIAPKAANLSATDTVKNFYAALTNVMKQGDQLGFAGRYKKLDPVVRQAFDLPLMTRFTVGLVWDKATPAEQQQITNAFSTFSIANYASRFTHYNGEQFIVVDEKPVSGGKLIETNLKPKNGDAVALNYLMRQDDTGAWRIIDVFLGGAVSELATRRAEFAAVIQRDGIGALVNALDEKSKQMGPS